MSSGVGAGDGVGGGAVSASSITTVATTGSHMVKIKGYSAAKLALPNGRYAKSCEFEAAGHTWCILYYPNGSSEEVADHISLYLRLARNVNNIFVSASYRFTLLVPHHCNDGGEPKAKPPQVVPYHRQSGHSTEFRLYAHGVPRFIRREVLEKSDYLVDDSFVVRCDIDSFAVRSDIDSFAVQSDDIEVLVETSEVSSDLTVDQSDDLTVEARTTCSWLSCCHGHSEKSYSS